MIARLLLFAMIAVSVFVAIVAKIEHGDNSRLKQIENACFEGSYILDNVGTKYMCINLGRFTHEDARHD